MSLRKQKKLDIINSKRKRAFVEDSLASSPDKTQEGIMSEETDTSKWEEIARKTDELVTRVTSYVP